MCDELPTHSMSTYSIVSDPDVKATTVLDALCRTTLVKSRGEGRKLKPH